MKFILLSGGSGKRLWPLSNNSRSKQFLKILKNPKTNETESMIQRVWREMKSLKLTDDTYITTCMDQVDMVQSQLGIDVPIIIEPSRRDTFPAIALATSYLHSIEKVDCNEVICFLPVDPYVENLFYEKLKQLEEIIKASSGDIALVGVPPTYPSEKYGYIVPSLSKQIQSDLSYHIVSRFIEKPNKMLSKELIEMNSLWNSGVFAFRIQFLLDQLSIKDLPLEYEELSKKYHELPQISFDYEVVEKADKVVVKTYEGSWKDLGTWNTLTEEMDTNQIGDGILSKDCKNTHLINELNLPVVIQGLSDVIVAASPDGILVTQKDSSHKIKSLIEGINNRPMFEVRRWGNYRVLDYESFGEQNVLTKKLTILAGKNLSYQTHQKRSEVWTIVKGEGLFAFEDKIHHVIPGSVLQIPVGMKHAIKAISDLQIIEVQTGTELVEEDIERICMTWSEIERHCSN